MNTPKTTEQALILAFLKCGNSTEKNPCQGTKQLLVQDNQKKFSQRNTLNELTDKLEPIDRIDGYYMTTQALKGVKNFDGGFFDSDGYFIPLTAPIRRREDTLFFLSPDAHYAKDGSGEQDRERQNRAKFTLRLNVIEGKNKNKSLRITTRDANEKKKNDFDLDLIWIGKGITKVPTWYNKVFASEKVVV